MYKRQDENGVKMNAYFVDHPEMVLGEWKTVSGRFGEEDTAVSYTHLDVYKRQAVRSLVCLRAMMWNLPKKMP